MRKPGGKVVWNLPRSLSSAVTMRTRRMRSFTVSFPRLRPTHRSLDESPKTSIPCCPHVSEGKNCQGPSKTKFIKFRFSPWSTTQTLSPIYFIFFLSIKVLQSVGGRSELGVESINHELAARLWLVS